MGETFKSLGALALVAAVILVGAALQEANVIVRYGQMYLAASISIGGLLFLAIGFGLDYLLRIAKAVETLVKYKKGIQDDPIEEGVYMKKQYWLYDDNRVVADIDGQYTTFGSKPEFFDFMANYRRSK
jgi:hypothetical protein